MAAGRGRTGAPIRLSAPEAPPAWALLQRQLLRDEGEACQEYFDHYLDERGYLKCVVRWGGNDGPDDAIETLTDWPTLHLLGGADHLLDLYKLGWEGHLRQYSEARTTEVPFARDGMYYREFPVMFDWVHNGEGLVTFNLQGLSDPRDAAYERRLRRYAAFYTGEDPDAPNYDPEHRIIRSMFSGSRGPLLRQATPLDWAGDPIEVEGRFLPRHGERTYREMLEHFREYTDVVGDHPQNMVATGLGLNAFALTGEDEYRDWVLEYVGAWRERLLANDDVIPTNIGLDGTVGGECGGRWYGGCYGWNFTVTVPQTGGLAHRNTHYLGQSGFGNALLLSGDQSWVDPWRRMIDRINSEARDEDGQTLYPHMCGGDGWYDYTPAPYSAGALETWYWSMDRADLERLDTSAGWLGYLEGNDASFPERALRGDLETLRARTEGMRADATTPDTRMSDDPMVYNPAITGSLVQLMLGGLPPRHAQPLHCRFRYFDPENRRAGLPPHVAALVESLGPDTATLHLVNTSPVHQRTLVVQGGAYGEHHIESVTDEDGASIPVDGAHVPVTLEPGAGGRLQVRHRRYASDPTLDFPWT